MMPHAGVQKDPKATSKKLQETLTSVKFIIQQREKDRADMASKTHLTLAKEVGLSIGIVLYSAVKRCIPYWTNLGRDLFCIFENIRYSSVSQI